MPFAFERYMYMYIYLYKVSVHLVTPTYLEP